MATNQKILICDGEEDIRESLKLILGDHYDLILTDSGEQCLETLDRETSIGLVLLDIKMPKVNGLDALKSIKERHPGTNVIIITGYKSGETAVEDTKPGAAGYIVKPLKSEEILDRVGKSIKG